ncbi:collagen-flanked surface repeat-containing protein [Streptococcus tangpeifui]|uniref:collagen-flanked surface repeat-containing protein n=2 Tax=Streptococcus tangpeifui TaxID=2709400 RepID=UPI0013ED397B|nr:putative Ig domain-containing protein [Streptococcus sp. ZJ373]
MKPKPRKSKYSIQRKEYFSIRKFKFGAASALIGVSLFATGSVLAEEQPQTQSTVVAVQSSEGSAGQSVGSDQAVTPTQDAGVSNSTGESQASLSRENNSLAETSQNAEQTTDNDPTADHSQVSEGSQSNSHVSDSARVNAAGQNAYVFYKVRYVEQGADGSETTIAQTPAKSLVIPADDLADKIVTETANLNQLGLSGYALAPNQADTQAVAALELQKSKYVTFYVQKTANQVTAAASNGQTSAQHHSRQIATEQRGGQAQSTLGVTIGRDYQSLNEASSIRPIAITATQSGQAIDLVLMGNVDEDEEETSDSKAAQAELSFSYTKEGTAEVVDGLPAGLFYDAESGQLTGAVLQSGQYTIKATVQAADGATASKTIDLDVNALPKSDQAVFSGRKISGIAVNGGINAVSTKFSYSATIQGETVTKDGLPEGLVYDSSTGKIEGQVAQAGSYTILSQASVEATNPDGTYVGSGAVTYVTESHLYVAEQNGPGLPSVSLTANPINASAVSAQPTQSGGSVFRAVAGENPVGTVHLGDNATPSNNHDTAIGYYAETNVDLDNKGGAVALGTYTKANGENAIAIGNTANAGANSAIALGGKASGVGAINIGYTASADADSSVSVGYYANAKAANSIALGTQAKSKAILSSAVGPSAESTYYNSVALGAYSRTDSEATAENEATVNNITYSGFAGQVKADGDQVSVGYKDKERQIKNVAAGAISESSTDAVNGSQLYLLTRDYHWIATSGTAGTGTQNQVNDTNVAPDAQQVHGGDTITFRAGNGLNIEQNGNVFTYSINTQKPKLEITPGENGTYTVKYTDAFGQEASAQFTVNTIKGEKGDKGDTGAAGRDGVDGKAGAAGYVNVVDNHDGTKTITTGTDTNGDGVVSEDEKSRVTVSDGAQGAKGDKGDTGAAGRDGRDGVDGKDGKAGAAGFVDVVDNHNGTKTITTGTDTNGDGIVSDDEKSSVTVSDGAQGAKGDKGDKGAKGDTGAAGRDGRDGVDGKAGAAGYVNVVDNHDGTKTITTGTDTNGDGIVSDDEKNSVTVSDGAKGDTGAKGDKGEKGDTGAKGDKGDTGAAGRDGVDGKDGKAGAAGFVDVKDNNNGTKTITTGTDTNGDGVVSEDEKSHVTVSDGAQGAKGDTGAAGRDGRDGKDGKAGAAGFVDVVDNHNGTKTITTGTDTNGDGIVSDDEKSSVTVSDGAQGAKGDKGDKGDTGVAGRDGVDGKAGAAGFVNVVDNNNGTKTITTGTDTNGDGVVSDDEKNSVTVSDGAQGVKGDKGDTGATGRDGVDGKAGAAGYVNVVDNHNGTKTITTGTDIDGDGIISDDEKTSVIVSDGAQGAKGDKGDTGAAGRDGVDGKAGAAGFVDVVDNHNGTKTITTGTDTNGDGVVSENEKSRVTVSDGAQGVKGDKGEKGDTGAQGAKGDTGATGRDGVDGKDGKAGAAGFVNVVDNHDGIKTITTGTDTNGDGIVSDDEKSSVTVSDGAQGVKGDKGDKGDTGAAGRDGVDGRDGKSATATVKDNGNGTYTITLMNGDGTTSSVTVRDGKDGKDGKAPIVQVTDNHDGSYTITVTNADGSTSTVTVRDGKDGRGGICGCPPVIPGQPLPPLPPIVPNAPTPDSSDDPGTHDTDLPNSVSSESRKTSVVVNEVPVQLVTKKHDRQSKRLPETGDKNLSFASLAGSALVLVVMVGVFGKRQDGDI